MRREPEGGTLYSLIEGLASKLACVFRWDKVRGERVDGKLTSWGAVKHV
jgi:hypothetical protein